jgi:hypothetical protein
MHVGLAQLNSPGDLVPMSNPPTAALEHLSVFEIVRFGTEAQCQLKFLTCQSG